MKYLLFSLLATTLIFSSCDKETVLESNKVPSEINSYVTTHFPDHAILQVIKDMDGTTKTYDLTLEKTVRLEFNRKKEVIDIESQNKLPDSVIPSKILDYVSSTYPSNSIIGWELEEKGRQQVKLDNELELEFDKDSNFTRIE